MEYKILNKIPKIHRENKPSYLQQVKELMGKMKVGQIAVIPKKKWQAKTAPWRMWQTYRIRKGIKYTFSGRQDKDNYYLMKEKFPLETNGTIRRVWSTNQKGI